MYNGILKVLLVDHVPLPNWILSHEVQQKHADKLAQLLWKILLHMKAQSVEFCCQTTSSEEDFFFQYAK